MSIRAFTMLLSALLFPASLSAQPLPFEMCAQSTTWVRPSPEEQAKIWNMGRYRGFPHDANDWGPDFLIIPNSASITYDLGNWSGLWTAFPIGQCHSAKTSQERENEWIEVWVLLHRVTQITHDANTYTITVEPTGAGFQSIMFRRLNPKAVFRFVTPDGTEVERWDESAPPLRFTNAVPPGAIIRRPNGQTIRK